MLLKFKLSIENCSEGGALQDQTVRIDFHFSSLKQSRVIGKHGFQSIFAFQLPKAQILGSQNITFE